MTKNCTTCAHAVVDRDSWSHLACAIPLPMNLIAALAKIVDSDGLRHERLGEYWSVDFPTAPVAPNHSCALWQGEDAVLDDDGLPT